jgi:hypothetical protein
VLSFQIKTLFFGVTLEALHSELSVGATRVNDESMLKFWWTFFIPPFFPLFSLLKYKDVLLFIFCIQFNPHSFDFYLFLFVFNLFWLIFSSISSLIIWFHLIFISNLILILLIVIFLPFPNWILF